MSEAQTDSIEAPLRSIASSSDRWSILESCLGRLTYQGQRQYFLEASIRAAETAIDSDADPDLEEGGGLMPCQAALRLLNLRGNPDLSGLVAYYSDMLSFFFHLNASVKKAQDDLECRLKLILDPGAESDQPVSERINKMHRYYYHSVGNLISKSLSDSFEKIHNCHCRLLRELETKILEKEKKLKCARIWYKISISIFATLSTTLLICTVVDAMTMVPSTIAGALAFTTAAPITSVGRWIKSLWNYHIRKIKDDCHILKKMQVHMDLHSKKFMSLCMLKPRFKEHLEVASSMIRFADHPGGNTMTLIKKKMKTFVNDLDDLQAHIKRCETHIHYAVSVIVESNTTRAC